MFKAFYAVTLVATLLATHSNCWPDVLVPKVEVLLAPKKASDLKPLRPLGWPGRSIQRPFEDRLLEQGLAADQFELMLRYPLRFMNVESNRWSTDVFYKWEGAKEWLRQVNQKF